LEHNYIFTIVISNF